MRRELARLLLCALACAAALAPPGGARAAGGIGTLYSDLVCREMTDVPKDFVFETSFVGLAACAKLCASAGLVCGRDVDEAASCQTAFVADFITFDSRLDCDGLKGTRLHDCLAGWAVDKRDWLASVKQGQATARAACATLAGKCTRSCATH